MHSGAAPTDKQSREERRPCVLFVDEDSATLQVTGDLIQHCGYETVRRFEYEIALRSFERMPDAYDIVVIGCSRDSGSSRQLAAEIRRLDPFVPILFYMCRADDITRDDLNDLYAWTVLKPAPGLQWAGTLMTLLGQASSPLRPVSTRAAKSRAVVKPRISGSEADQLNRGGDLKLSHEVGAMKLNGAIRDSEHDADLFVKMAGHDQS